MIAETIDIARPPFAIAVRRAMQAGRTALAAVALSALAAGYAAPVSIDGNEEPYDEATMVAISLLCAVHF